MKRSTRYVLFAVAVLLALMACATAPEPEPEPLPPVETDTELVQAQREQAELLRRQIVDADLAQYAPQEFDRGDEQFALGEAQRELDADQAIQHYRDASASYRRVIDRAFEEVVDVARSDAQSARSRADEVRARRGAPQPYEQGETRYASAESAREQRDFTPSLEGYRGARESFDEAYEVASERRDRAREAMDSADRAIARTEDSAQDLEDELDDELEDEE